MPKEEEKAVLSKKKPFCHSVHFFSSFQTAKINYFSTR